MKKRALLVGINRYRIDGADLRGCVNDVNSVKQMLLSCYGFSASNIRILTDFRATKARMVASFGELLESTKSGDVAYFHYSGHGSNVPDADGDEADYRDEILCPTNLDWKDPITDDWLRATIDKHAKKKRMSLTIVMDCCHSGTNTRALVPPDAPVINRFLPNPWDIMAEESGRELSGKTRRCRGLDTQRKSASARSLTAPVEVDIPELLITGCRDFQTSADALIDKDFHGALTYYLVKAVMASQGKLTVRELHQKAIKLLKASGYQQTPQLEGRAAAMDQPFLGIPE